METMKEVLENLYAEDQVKIASAEAEEQLGVPLAGVDPELVKQAQEYDFIGRVLAHNAFADLVKEALDEEMAGEPEDKKKEALQSILAKARGDKKPEDEKKPEGDKKPADKEDEEEAEKKAAVRQAVLDKMASDPEYAAYLAAKYLEQD